MLHIKFIVPPCTTEACLFKGSSGFLFVMCSIQSFYLKKWLSQFYLVICLLFICMWLVSLLDCYAYTAIIIYPKQAGLTAADEEIGDWLRKNYSDKYVILAVNKCESPRKGVMQASEFWSLG